MTRPASDYLPALIFRRDALREQRERNRVHELEMWLAYESAIAHVQMLGWELALTHLRYGLEKAAAVVAEQRLALQ